MNTSKKNMRMKGLVKVCSTFTLAVLLVNTVDARIAPNSRGGSSSANGSTRAAGCAPATALTKLAYNNVSAIIETGGNMWQDRATGVSGYEVPKGSGQFAIYAGALWLGGKDFNNQLKVAAITFRQNNDFWPGPLLTDGSAEVDAATCLKYDKFFITNRQEVANFVAYNKCVADPNCDEAAKFPGYQIPASILNWPGNNYDAGYNFQLAPYKDVDNDLVYNPLQGDYPWYDIEKELTCGNDRTVTLFGDQNYWWVFNDKGNIHTETGADPIGMEIHAQAFAFSTNDEVNNMTFYNYELINRGTQTLFSTYFGQWADADLGFAEDDFVGCDVQRGLGYAYNGDPFDEAGNGQPGYGNNPPAIGIDFFEGPFQDNDGVDNPLTTNIQNAIDSLGIPYRGIGIGYGDGVIDNERFGMRKFLYYFRADQTPNPNQGEPDNGNDYYNYLRGIWLDGTPFYVGGTAHISSPGAQGNGLIECDYMFPGDTDPLLWGTRGVTVANYSLWTEANEGNTPADRRFMQSAGPFTLVPGQKNNITVGVVYARATSGNTFESVRRLQFADDKAQALFDNCFKILDAPHAPDLTIQELDKELILYLSYPQSSIDLNLAENYVEKDPFIILPPSVDNGSLTTAEKDSLASYRFQGYKIYQLKDATVSSADLSDADKARLVFQCDVKDGVTRLVNFIKDEDLGYDIPTLMVDGADEGIKHSFRVTQDAFTQKALINHKTYYFMAVAYAYNNYKTFDPNDGLSLDGQKKPYIESRQSATGEIAAVAGIPHIPVPEAGGTMQMASYGDGPEITRIEGTGNGGLYLDLNAASESYIINNFKMPNPTYVGGRGPIDVKIIDPLNVIGGTFEIRLLPDGSSSTTVDRARWEMYAAAPITVNGTTYAAGQLFTTSDQTIDIGNEQLIPELGISVSIQQTSYVIKGLKSYTELVSAEVIYSDSSKRWLSGVKDLEGNSPANWIRSGTQDQACNSAIYTDQCDDPCLYNDYLGTDDEETFESLVEGTWAPYYLCARSQLGDANRECPVAAPIGWTLQNTLTMGQPKNLPSVDIVFTADKSKWTRCPVLEMQESQALAEGGAKKQMMRKAPSVDKNGNPDGTGTGMGWFPGYAIDIETGERLNMAFGEDSWLAVENGRDMKFNPTGRLFSSLGEPLFGGKHYVYVFRNEDKDVPGTSRMPAYDGGFYMESMLNNPSNTANLIKAWRSCVWVGTPMLEKSFNFNDPSQIPTDVRIKIRVTKTYERYSTGYTLLNDTSLATNGWRPKYRFSLDGLAVQTNQTEMVDSILSLVNVVPNPYYAYSAYETNKLDNRVKIVNLPEVCTINIFNVAGQLIRTFTKDSPITSLDWDLKNNAGIPISSGVYIIHVELPDGSETVVKWFGGMRPPDLESF